MPTKYTDKPDKPRPLLWQSALRTWWQPLLGLALAVLVGLQVHWQGDLALWWAQLLQNIGLGGRWVYLLVVWLLVPLNWGMESRKWYVLLRAWWPSLRYSAVIRAVLAGIAVSLATPNRIGEYGGRALLLPWQRAADVVLSSLVGSWCQWLVFLVFGWPAAVYQLHAWLAWPVAYLIGLALVVPLSIVLILILGPHWFSRLAAQKTHGRWAHYKWWRWLRLKLRQLLRLEKRIFFSALLWASLRFLTYSVQYLFLLWCFGVSLSVWEGLTGIFCIYLIQAGIPLPPGLGVMTRSELAILIWSGSQIHPLSVLGATFTLYVLNLLLPAVPGFWLIVRHRSAKP